MTPFTAEVVRAAGWKGDRKFDTGKYERALRIEMASKQHRCADRDRALVG